MTKILESTGTLHCKKCNEEFMIVRQKDSADDQWAGIAYCPFCGVEQEHITIPSIPVGPNNRQIQNSKKGDCSDAID